MSEPEIDSLDHLIDSALATYADCGTDPELPRRVLTRISAGAAPAPHRRWLPWLIALPIGAVLLFLIMPSGSKPMHKVPNYTSQANGSQPMRNALSGSEPSVSAHSAAIQRANTLRQQSRATASVIKAKPLPKLDVFPTPRPLAPAERAFVNYVAQAPEAERQALVEAQRQIDQPLSIAAIDIQPLAPPETD